MRPIADNEPTMTANAEAVRILTSVPAPRTIGDPDGEDPFADSGPASRNLFGAMSVERFAAVGSLSGSHRDAGGFLDYLERFAPRNFWYRDGGVKSWAYHDEFDDWEDTFGADAVRVIYHSGHGSTGPDGVFRVPMGAAWQGRDITATSDGMRLGDGHARYVFWSCSSALRISGGHSPIRTWSSANAGVRMMFGFDDHAFDSPDYGTYFWRQWRAGVSLSNAWLTACSDVADDHTPVVLACGRDRAEAVALLDGERHFANAPVDTSWWQWRWHSSGRPAREPNTAAPPHPERAVLAPLAARGFADLGERFDVDTSLRADRGGVVVIGAADRRLHVGDGMLALQLKSVSSVGMDGFSRAVAVQAGGQAVRRFGLDADGPLVLDRVVEVREAGGSRTAVVDEPRTVQSIVVYRQMINGVPILSGDAGLVRVWVGNDGGVRAIQSSTRAVLSFTGRLGATTAEPTADGGRAPEPDADTSDAQLAAALGDHLRHALTRGGHPHGYSVLPGTREVGYHVHGDTADLVVSQSVELEFDAGYRSRIRVWAPLSG